MAMSGKVLGEQMAELARLAAREKFPPISESLQRRIDVEWDEAFRRDVVAFPCNKVGPHDT
jgi:hypothetical protein